MVSAFANRLEGGLRKYCAARAASVQHPDSRRLDPISVACGVV